MESMGGGGCVYAHTDPLVVEEVAFKCLASSRLLLLLTLLILTAVVVATVGVPLAKTHPTEV